MCITIIHSSRRRLAATVRNLLWFQLQVEKASRSLFAPQLVLRIWIVLSAFAHSWDKINTHTHTGRERGGRERESSCISLRSNFTSLLYSPFIIESFHIDSCCLQYLSFSQTTSHVWISQRCALSVLFVRDRCSLGERLQWGSNRVEIEDVIRWQVLLKLNLWFWALQI